MRIINPSTILIEISNVAKTYPIRNVHSLKKQSLTIAFLMNTLWHYLFPLKRLSGVPSFFNGTLVAVAL